MLYLGDLALISEAKSRLKYSFLIVFWLKRVLGNPEQLMLRLGNLFAAATLLPEEDGNPESIKDIVMKSAKPKRDL